MNTRTDIRDGEQLTITVLVTEIDEWQNHDHIARKVLCKDIERNELPLTIFHNNDAVEYDWDVGQWYKLKNATGNVYRGEKQLNPSYDFGIIPLDEPPEEATFVDDTPGLSNTSGNSDGEAEFQKASTVPQSGKTTADGGAALAQQPLSQGNYLLHFPMGELSELTVHVYKLNVPGGLDPSDEDLERGVLGFTAKAAALYRYRSDGPVTTNGRLKVYAVNKLRDELAVDGYTVQPEHVGTETLEARSFDDQESLLSVAFGSKSVEAAIKQGVARPAPDNEPDESQSDNDSYTPAVPVSNNKSGLKRGVSHNTKSFNIVFESQTLLTLVEIADEVAAEIDLLIELDAPDFESGGQGAV